MATLHVTRAAPMAPTEPEDPMMTLRNENMDLRKSLLQIREDYQELKHDCNFHQVKVAELNEILELRSKDEISEKLVATSMQNAELSFELDRLKKELKKSAHVVTKLGGQKEQSKVMLLELCDIVKALQSVDVEYSLTDEPEDGKNMSLENIKKKVETIMEDRRLLVRRCKELEKANKDKDEKLLSLEAQYHLLNSMNYAKGRTTGPEDPFSVPVEDDAISRTSSAYTSASKSLSVNTPTKTLDIDMDVIRSPVKQSGSSEEETCAPSEEASDMSTVEVHAIDSTEESEVERLKSELEESKQRYQHFMTICQTAFAKMKDVEFRFTQVQEDLDNVSDKRDALRENLKDVIDQYKELHEEQSRTVADLDEANAKIKSLERIVKDLEAARTHVEQRGAEALQQEGLKEDVEMLAESFVKAKETIAALEAKLISAARETEEAQKKLRSSQGTYRNSIAQCQKLKMENTVLQGQLSEIKHEIKSTKKEAQRQKEAAKHDRRRLTAYMQGKGEILPNSALLQSSTLESASKRELFLLEVATAGKAWNKAYNLAQERQKLTLENKDLRALCVEMLNDMGEPSKKKQSA